MTIFTVTSSYFRPHSSTLESALLLISITAIVVLFVFYSAEMLPQIK